MSGRSSVVNIGKCAGCDRTRTLDCGVCSDCLRPPRGRNWAMMSHRVRTDPAFAVEVFCKLKTAWGRELFVRAYGLPFGADRERSDA